MKKIIKITKIFLVLLTIFSQLSPAATALADEIVDNYESVENSNENVKSLAINGYLNYNEGEITKSLDGEMNSDNLVIYNVNAKVYTQILTISGDEIEDDVEYSVKVNDNESTVITGSELKSGIMGTTTDFTNSFNSNDDYLDCGNLNVGKNKLLITVKAENETENTYTFIINRKDEKDNLVDNEITTNNKTGDSLIIVICVVAILSLIVSVYYVKKKNKAL